MFAIEVDNEYHVPSPSPSPVPVPPPPHGPLPATLGSVALSPQTALVCLEHPDLSLTAAKGIALGLAHTIAKRTIEASSNLHAVAIAQDVAHEAILTNMAREAEEHLVEVREEHRRETMLNFPKPPEGFTENQGRLLQFRIQLSAEYGDIQAPYIRLCPTEHTMAEGTRGGAGDPVYLMELFANPRLGAEDHTLPLPHWFTEILGAGSRHFNTARQRVLELDDWGLTTDIARYYASNLRIAELHHHLDLAQQELDALYNKRDQTCWRLEAAEAPQRLESLRYLSNTANRFSGCAEIVGGGCPANERAEQNNVHQENPKNT